MDTHDYCSNIGKSQSVSCVDIYDEVTERYINALKISRESKLRSSSKKDGQLFQYADPEFYSYRTAIDRQERNTYSLLKDIIFKVMDRYGVKYLIPSSSNFVFIICIGNDRIGYRFIEFNSDEDVNKILRNDGVDKAYIIKSWKSGTTDKWIERDNKQYKKNGLRLSEITVEQFFNDYFGAEEYASFENSIDRFVSDSKEILGYKSIKFLSLMNLAAQKEYEEKELKVWQYKTYRYQIINPCEKKIADYLYLSQSTFPAPLLDLMEQQYISNALLKAMTGNKEFSQSFITSEWLYHSLSGKKNFDYTAVISGYLKSIEQLLYSIVMINVDNNCRITMNGSNDTLNDAQTNNVQVYKKNKHGWRAASITDKGYKYMDLTHDQVQYMDSSIGTFEYFLRNNPHIFIDPGQAKMIADMISCFRTECRNGYFHTHNLNDWSVVEKTRSNAIYLYFVILGSCKIPCDKKNELGIIVSDDFDELCKRIRKFDHISSEFIFEYADGLRIKLIYDFINNTIEYSSDGVEHYDSLLFYRVEEFSLEELEKLDAGIQEDQIVYITRDSLPAKIYGVHRDGHLEEICV